MNHIGALLKHQIINQNNLNHQGWEALFFLAEALFKFPWTMRVTNQTYDVYLENLYSFTV